MQDYPVVPMRNIWADTGTGSFTDPKIYVVQTNMKVIQGIGVTSRQSTNEEVVIGK
jgi:hypothetical protein